MLFIERPRLPTDDDVSFIAPPSAPPAPEVDSIEPLSLCCKALGSARSPSCTAPAMAVAYSLPQLSHESVQNIRSLLKFSILATIAGAAVASRLFAVIRHESIIHELWVAEGGQGS